MLGKQLALDLVSKITYQALEQKESEIERLVRKGISDKFNIEPPLPKPLFNEFIKKHCTALNLDRDMTICFNNTPFLLLRFPKPDIKMPVKGEFKVEVELFKYAFL